MLNVKLMRGVHLYIIIYYEKKFNASLYLKKAKVKKSLKTEVYWVCNDDIAMLLCNQEKYIYYKQPKYLVSL